MKPQLFSLIVSLTRVRRFEGAALIFQLFET